MAYRITKECGVGWNASLAVPAWGVSATQRKRAEKVMPGDIFIHYIDYAHAWAGYSKVCGVLQNNNRDSDPDVVAALPFVIPIQEEVWLDEGQCESTVQILHQSNKYYHRQAAFTLIPPAEAELIIEAIKVSLKSGPSTASPAFHLRWMVGAESYYKGIVKGRALGKCWLCEEDAASWAARVSVVLSKAEIELSDEALASVRDSFLDAAHILANSKKGPMTPENLRPLCPTCHRVVDKLSIEQREKLLRKK